MFSPSGMTLAEKYEAGVLSLGSMFLAGMRSLPNQWSFAEESAVKHGTIVDRKKLESFNQLAHCRNEAKGTQGGP